MIGLRTALAGVSLALSTQVCASGEQTPLGMTCSPESVRASDVVSLTFPFPHGAYLTIRAPGDSVSFFVAYPLQPVDEERREFNGPFRNARTHRLNVADADALKWIVDSRPTKIFQKPGKYLIEVGSQFETEDPIVEGSCTVTYRP